MSETLERTSFDNLHAVAPLSLQKAMQAIPVSIFEMTDKELEKKFKLDHKVIIKRLRLSLWNEADRATNTRSPFRLNAIYEGFCDRHFFLRKVLGNSYALAYVIRRPLDYNILMTDMLYAGLELSNEVLHLDHIKDDGSLDHKLLQIKMSIVESVHNRLKGTPVSRSEIVQTTLPAKQSGQVVDESVSLKEIQAEIKRLKGSEE